MGVGGKLYRQGLIKMNEFVTLCARDRLPMIWIQDTTGIDVGDDAEVAELLGLGQSLIYSIQSSKLPMMEITLRRGTAAAHYVLGGPQGNDNNAFSLGTAATEINVMNGETAANAMYLPKVIKYNSKNAEAAERYAEIAKFINLPGSTTEELVDALIAELREMNKQLNIPLAIKNYGEGGVIADKSIIDEKEFNDKLSEVAANAIGDACTGSNPRQPSQEEMEKLLLAVYYDKEIDF